MKRFCALSLCLWLLSTSFAEDLCGPPDQEVCMMNSTAFALNTNGQTLSNSVYLALIVPGLEVDAPPQVDGDPTENYYFDALAGSINDNQGNSWSGPMSHYSDEYGTRVLLFQMLSGSLPDGSVLELHDITVCQQVSDGPGPVFLRVQLWFANKNKRAKLASEIEITDQFAPCSEYFGHLPAIANDDKAWLVNPWDYAVVVDHNGESETHNAGAQWSVPGGELASISSSSPLAIVIESSSEDLNLVSIESKDHDSFLVPHISNNPDSWKNEWKCAIPEDMRIDYQVGSQPMESQFMFSNLYSMEIQSDGSDTPHWMRLNSADPINGYFEFNRIDGIAGGAALNGLRLSQKPFGSSTLYLAHVATDIARFWTGFGLVNPNEETANCVLRCFDEDGNEQAAIPLTLEPGQKTVELIDSNFSENWEQFSWIQIESDIPLAGLELFGGQSSDQPYLAGFLLGERVATDMRFPYINTNDGWWSGVALLNPDTHEVSGTLQFLDSQGMLVEENMVTLMARQKQTFLAPEGATQARWLGQACTGFALTGDNIRQKLGGYNGIQLTP